MAERIFISFGKNGLGQYQASIETQQADGSGHGYRFAGAKYDGTGTELFRAEIDEHDAREIRHYLTRLDADELTRLRALNAELVEALDLQVRNCPLCKGTGKAVHAYEALTGSNEKKDCSWCAKGRTALAKARAEES